MGVVRLLVALGLVVTVIALFSGFSFAESFVMGLILIGVLAIIPLVTLVTYFISVSAKLPELKLALQRRKSLRLLATVPSSSERANAMRIKQQLEATYTQVVNGQSKIGEAVQHGVVIYAQVAEAIEAIRQQPGRSPQVQRHIDYLAHEMQMRVSQALIGMTKDLEIQIKNQIIQQ